MLAGIGVMASSSKSSTTSPISPGASPVLVTRMR
jgi:hypothetical protein